jgi:hypothetical protein
VMRMLRLESGNAGTWMTYGGAGYRQVCHKVEFTQFAVRHGVVGQHCRLPMQFPDQLGDFISLLSNTGAGCSQAMAPYT